MSIPSRMQSTRLKHAARYPGQGVWRAYADGVELLNPGGTTPVIKQLSINEAMAVAALSGVAEDVAFWMLRHLGTAQAINQSWTISLDGGLTTFAVQCVQRGVKTAATANTSAVFEYVFKGNSVA